MGQREETIAAIATPPGRGGIGVVRLSGPRAREIGESLLRLRQPLEANRAQFGYMLDPAAEASAGGRAAVLDEVVTTLFAGPQSYTAEDVVEISAHGSPVVLEMILRTAVERGARLAEPGEFTQRAFLAGRLDLTQAEAVHDLISATTLHQARVAAGQMGGSVSRVVQPVKRNLVSLIATLEAGIDFAEDDLEVMAQDEVVGRIEAITGKLRTLERSFGYGQRLREGLALVLAGRPNAGKSSLFNALLQRDRAIVTAVPGTTRDAITERLLLAGIPLELTDTAGLRETTDEVEALGVARSRETVAEAGLILFVVDAFEGASAEELGLLAGYQERSLVVAVNKTDLVSVARVETLMTQLRGELGGGVRPVACSAKTGAGIEELRLVLEGVVAADAPAQDSAVLTNLRQQRAIREAILGLEEAAGAIKAEIPHEMVLLDLHAGLHALDTLTGTTTTEDLLQVIFSSFCIGK